MASAPKAPLHVPIALGVTAGLYAISLAGVTALQARNDAALAASHRPLADAVAGVTSERAALERDLHATVDALNAASSAYGTAANGTSTLNASLARLARQVAAATGAAARIPQTSGLPAAPGTVTVATAPTTQATTGASGKP